jgi:hypothetical protein
MAFEFCKRVLPNRPILTRIWRGPFRGARIVMNPRDSLRKIFGLYEHELNNWLEQALPRVSRIVDVGANDGYFTFGSAAAFRRLGKTGEIIACEPQESHVAMLRESIATQAQTGIRFKIVHALVGRESRPGMITLDSLRAAVDDPNNKVSTLVKIDVEGAEVEVIEGGRSWLQRSNYFVIEVHQHELVRQLRDIFAEKGLKLVQLNQQRVRVIGGELRERESLWLVSDLGAACQP